MPRNRTKMRVRMLANPSTRPRGITEEALRLAPLPPGVERQVGRTWASGEAQVRQSEGAGWSSRGSAALTACGDHGRAWGKKAQQPSWA